MVATATPTTPVIDRAACPSTKLHGRRNHRWRYGCTCPDAVEDQRRYNALHASAEFESSLVNALGARRRLQALAVIGYGIPYLARYIGMSQSHLTRIRDGVIQHVNVDINSEVTETYRRLAGTPRTTRQAKLTARNAAARQWAGPDQWGDIDDPDELHAALVDERLDDVFRRTDAHVVPTVDLLELAQHMRVDGRPDHDAIGRRVGMSAEAVQKRLERRSPIAGARLTGDQVYAIRDEYLRTRGAGWNGKAVGARYGVSKVTVSHIIHGTTRPELGLTDLTAHPGGHHTAATPTGGSIRKEINAA